MTARKTPRPEPGGDWVKTRLPDGSPVRVATAKRNGQTVVVVQRIPETGDSDGRTA